MKTKQPEMKSNIVKPQAAATMPSLGAFSPSRSPVSSAPILVAVGKDIHQSVFMAKFLDVAYLHRTLFLAVFHAFVQLPLLVAHHHLIHVVLGGIFGLFRNADLLESLASLLFKCAKVDTGSLSLQFGSTQSSRILRSRRSLERGFLQWGLLFLFAAFFFDFFLLDIVGASLIEYASSVRAHRSFLSFFLLLLFLREGSSMASSKLAG